MRDLICDFHSNLKPLLLLLALHNAASFVFTLTTDDVPHCEKLKSEISDAQQAVKVRKNFNGLWVSPRCEIQPGPKFILRRYHFYRDLNFRIVRFYFNDPWCCSPAFSVTAVGRFESLGGRWSSAPSTSWIVPGGLEMEYFLSRVVLVPFSSENALFLSSKVNQTCPGSVTKPWKLHRKYLVLSLEYPSGDSLVQGSSSGEIDCTGQLDLTFHELQLLRLEQRPTATSFLRRPPNVYYDYEHRRKSHRRVSGNHRLELYLGAEVPGKQMLRPTSYQSPLYSPKDPGCETCQLIERATRTSPPRLCTVLENQHQFDLEGEWISQRCEVRPQGFFLRQHFMFRGDSREWWGEHVYYLDQNCRRKVFKLRAQGHFFKGPASKIVAGARDVDFHIEHATLTPEDNQFVDNLNGLDNNSSCSLNAKWRRDVPVNLTATSGCKALGVLVPSIELDLVKLEKHKSGDTMLLYLGQAAENGSRPTSFQPPLLNCRSEERASKQEEEPDNFLRPLAQIQLPKSGVTSSRTSSVLSNLFIISWVIVCKYTY